MIIYYSWHKLFLSTLSNRWRKTYDCSLYLLTVNFSKCFPDLFISVFTCAEFLLTFENFAPSTVLCRLSCNSFSISCLAEVNRALKGYQESDGRIKGWVRILKFTLEIGPKCRNGNITKLCQEFLKSTKFWDRCVFQVGLNLMFNCTI